MTESPHSAGSHGDQRKHVAIIANTAWYIYNFRSNLIRLLTANGWMVSVICPDDEYSEGLRKLVGERVYGLKHLSRKGKDPMQDYRLYKEIKACYAKLKPDVVLQYTIKPNIYGSIAARHLGIPAISVVPGLGHAFIQPSALKTIVTMLYKRSLKTNRYVIFENAEDRDELVRMDIITNEQARVFSGCGIDTMYFAPSENHQTKNGLRFLFAGRLIKEKGIVEFVAAAKMVLEQYPDTHFAIAGNIDTENPGGITMDEFRRLISSGSIEYLGFLQDVREAIRSADCVVLPSYYPEGLPRVLLESIAMETPVISTDSRGCRDAIEDGRNGFLAAPRDAHDLARKMRAFCALPDEDRHAMGRYGREKALTEFDDRIINAKYLELLTKSIQSD